MELGINPGYFQRDDSSDAFAFDLFHRLAAHGFRKFDFLSDVKCDDWERKAHVYREKIDEAGAVVHQSHAPYNRYHRDVTAEEFRPVFLRAFDAAHVLGAKTVVVHADEYRLSLGETWDPGKVCDAMYEFLAPAVERAEKLGMGVAIENLFEEHAWGTPRSRYCATTEELLSLVGRFRGHNVSVCWDFGHAKVAYEDAVLEEFRRVAPLVTCTHVHDNTHGDNHLVPFLGNLDWKGHMQVLRDAGYRGDITYEIVYGHIPVPLQGAFLDYLREVGNYLLSL